MEDVALCVLARGNHKSAFQQSDLQLPNTRFAVLGLGSSKCKLYDQAGRDLFKLFESRGAKAMIPLGEVDARAADKGESVFLNWTHNLEVRLQVPAHHEVKPRLQVEKAAPENYSWQKPKGWQTGSVINSRIVSAEGVTPVIYEFEIKLDESDGYEVAGHLAILPRNQPEIVEKVVTALKLNGDDVYKVIGEYEGPEFITVREMFSQYLDLQGLPTQFMMHAFSNFASDEGKQRIDQLINDPEHLIKYLENASVYEFICEFAQYGIPPLDIVFSYLPPMVLRTYSAASSPEADKTVMKLIVTKVGFAGKTGLASTYLSQCKPTDKIAVKVMNGVYTVNDLPTILCSVGTGIAPILSILDERRIKGIKGRCILFFGSRHRVNIPGLVEDIEKFKAAGAVDEVYYAFSRDHGADKKYYITDAMRDHMDELWEIWQNQESVLCYCGPPNGIADAIKNLMEDLSVEKGGMDRESAGKFVKKHRLLIESF